MKLKLSILLIFSNCTYNLMGQTIEEVVATPQRPSFSTSTATTHPGWVELEAGISIDKHKFDSPFLLKVGVTTKVELFTGLSPVVRNSNGVTKTGFGDIIIGVRYRSKDQNLYTPSAAGQFSIKFPTAVEHTQSLEKIEYDFLAIASHAMGVYAFDLNAGATLAGISNEETDLRVSGMFNVSRKIGANFGCFGEIFLLYNLISENALFAKTTAIGTAGCSYSVSPRLIFDVGINFNISDAPFDFRFLFGSTFS